MLRSCSPLLPRLRLLAALLLVALQVGRVGAEWLEDARMSGAEPVVLHVEDANSSRHCPPAHALDCAICVALATPGLPTRALPALPLVAARADAAPSAVLPLADAAAEYLPPSRAPPTA